MPDPRLSELSQVEEPFLRQEDLLDDLKQGRENENNYGFHPKTELPFLALLKRELYGKTDLSEITEVERETLISTTTKLSKCFAAKLNNKWISGRITRLRSACERIF